MASDAVGLERLSRILGYKLKKGNFGNTGSNLPQRIAVYCEANTDNQTGINWDKPIEILSAKQAGDIFGYGSPAHIIARILRPLSGGLVRGIPTYFFPQEAAPGASAKVIKIVPSGTATANATHTVVVAGRRGIDGDSYNVNIEVGDTDAIVCNKIVDVINNVLGSPVKAVNTSPVDEVVCTTKWEGKTAQGVGIYIDTNGNDAGMSYVVSQTAAGSGLPTVTDALTNNGNEWFTIALNSYGTEDDICDEFEAWNGIPDPENPTGRYAGEVMKPFIACTGSVADNPTAFTDARLLDVTIAICPAPGSDGLPMEAAANVIALFSRCAQDTPHRDILGRFYPDMPMALSSFAMMDYNVRDSYVKKGCSTVDNVAGRYQIQDFITTYHPVGEVPPQYRYCRNLMVDYNIRFRYYLLELANVIDKMIATDEADVDVEGVIKPKSWKQVLKGLAGTLQRLGLIARASFMENSIEVNIGAGNPDRFETYFEYERTGTVRISSTTVAAGFNFGNTE